MKVEPLLYGDRKVYTVASFNRGVADWLQRLPTLWIEGEVTELRRSDRWGSVFFTLKDPADGASLPASIPRRTFDALKLDLADGERIHVLGRPGALRGEGRVQAARTLARALRARCASGRDRAAEADARRRRALRRRPQAPAAPFSAADRTRDGQRRGCAPGRDHDDPHPLSACARSSSRRPSSRGRGQRSASSRRSSRSAASPESTWSSSRAAAAASTTCSPSATRASSAPSPPARCRSSRRSGTSRTRRSAISPPTCARRRRRRPASSSCRISKPCGSSSPARAARSSAACAG